MTLYKATDSLGGSCSTTNVGGYSFNNGAMYVALPELLDSAFEQLGMDRQTLSPLRQIVALQTSHVHAGGVVRFRAGGCLALASSSPSADPTAPQADVRRLSLRWRPLDLLVKEVIVRPFSMSTLIRKGWRELPKLRGTGAGELDRMVRDPVVRAALGSVTLYTGLAPQNTPVMHIIDLFAMLDDRFYLPEGGMGRITDVLADEFVCLGGEVHTSSPVKRILVMGGRVRGVLTAAVVLSPCGTSHSVIAPDFLDTCEPHTGTRRCQ